MQRGRSRWIPSFLAPLVVLGTMAVSATSSSAADALPPRTVAQVLTLITTNPALQFSGEVTKTANLGLPAINAVPNVSQAQVNQMKKTLPKAMADFIPKASVQGNLALVLGLLSGSQQANVFYNNPLQARVEILDQMSERNLIVNGTDAWYYDALQQTVLHASASPVSGLANGSSFLTMLSNGLSSLPLGFVTPSVVGDYLLRSVGTTTAVSLGANTVVAGRGAYQVVLTPRSPGTLVASVTIAVDGLTGLPLAVTINAVNQSAPAFTIAFDSIKFGPSDPSLFAFSPPVGATVKQYTLPSVTLPTTSSLLARAKTLVASSQSRLKTWASAGWATVVQLPPSSGLGKRFSSLSANPYFKKLTKPVKGGRVFSTALVKVLFTKDGRVFAGAVTTPVLLKAAR